MWEIQNILTYYQRAVSLQKVTRLEVPFNRHRHQARTK